jgi:hypothetical protein
VSKGIYNQLLNYRYEEDTSLGHRLYREIRQVEYVKEQTRKSKGKGLSVPVVSYQWETVATNFVEFEAAAVSSNFCFHHMHH